jgi:hypothetical protein
LWTVSSPDATIRGMTVSIAPRTQLAAVVVDWDGMSAYTKQRLTVPVDWRGTKPERIRRVGHDVRRGRRALR